MAINDVSLTSGMRSNLLSLQGTVDLLNRTQNRLSSGKKVNSAIDNPTSFFASQALTSRAGVIDSLKDAMGQAVQTITAADKGIKAITAMIEQAKGIAQSALSAESSTGFDTVSVTVNSLALSDSLTVGATSITAGPAGAATTNYDSYTMTFNSGDLLETGNVVVIGGVSFTASVGGAQGAATAQQFVVGATGNDTATNLKTAVDALMVGTFTITRTNNSLLIESGVETLGATSVQTSTGVIPDEVTISSVTSSTPAALGALEFAFTGNDIVDAINVANKIVASVAGFTATANNGVVTISQAAANVTTAEVSASSASMARADISADVELTNLVAQYNTMRTQIDELGADSGYKGKNLLSSDTAGLGRLTVQFEGTTLTVQGFDATTGTNGLNVTAANAGATDWTTGTAAINASITQLDNSLTTLRTNTSALAGNLSIITVRQDFSTNMINTLTSGSDKLVLADANEEGANMLMLQTRQSLSTTALSLSAQAAQSVLKLFG